MATSHESEPNAVTNETSHQAITANRLSDGVPIYFAGKGNWSPNIGDSLTSENGEALLADAIRGPLPLEAVGVYVIEVRLSEGTVQPVGLKEQIRAFGPTA